MNIYIMRGEEKFGPLTPDQFKEALSNGSILANDLVWHEGLPDWISAEVMAKTTPDLDSGGDFFRTEPATDTEDTPNRATKGGQKKLFIGIAAFIGGGLALVFFTNMFEGQHATPSATEAVPQVTPAPFQEPSPGPVSPAEEKLIADLVVEEAIREELKKPEGKLTEADLEKVFYLSFSDAQITDLGLKDVAKLFKLRTLHLSKTPITNAGLKEVAKLLYRETLDLNHTFITDEGLQELTTVHATAKLRTLALSDTEITDAGVEEVANFRNLTMLILRGTGITDAGLKEVAKLQKLRYLILSSSKVTDVGIKDVAKLQNLIVLHLDNTRITDVGLKEVAKLQKLKTLDLRDTKITKEDVAELKKALPNCNIYGP